MQIKIVNKPYKLFSINLQNVDKCIWDLIKTIFVHKCEKDFVNLSYTKEEFSLILPESYLKNLKNLISYFNIYPNTYNILQFYENYENIKHTSIFNKLSSFFEKEDISIFYINSYNNNYILLPSKDTTQVIKKLKEQGYTIEYDEC